jgi:hypothetical protein
MVINFFLGWFGFYLVKNSIARDYDTGVGQIIATTPLSRPVYLLGKWLSNFSVLSLMVFILMIGALIMQIIQGEDPQINLWALASPLVLIALPFMALVAGMAVLFETIRWLRGGLGNVIYFFLFATVITIIGIQSGAKNPNLDWLGINLVQGSMSEALRAVYPAYNNEFSLGMVTIQNNLIFHWSGIHWTLLLLMSRLVVFGLSLGIVLLGVIFFDRFDTSRGWIRVHKAKTEPAGIQEPPVVEPPADSVELRLTRLPVGRTYFRFGRLLAAELRLLLKGLNWWWYAVAAGLWIATLFSPLDIVRTGILPVAWIWPILLWSSLGSRETRFDLRQVVFSAPHPLGWQLPVAWLAGLLIALLAGSGAIARMLMSGDTPGMLAVLSGALFIPSLALALGVWSGSGKAFEVIYALWWYLGPIERLTPLDFIGSTGHGPWQAYLVGAGILFLLAALGRMRQLRG